MTAGTCLRGLIGLALLVTMATGDAQTRVFTWVDANGVVHYSDKAPDETIRTETVVVPPGPSQPVASAPFRRVEASETRNATAPDPGAYRPPAPECSSLSPVKLSGRTLRFLERNELPEPVSAELSEAFETVIKEMEGRWSGSVTGFDCGDRPRPVGRTVDSEVRIVRPAEFTVESTISFLEGDRQERLSVGIRNQRLWVDGGYATLSAASDRSLEFGYARGRTPELNRELYWRFELSRFSREMKVEQLTYLDGTLIASSTWDLHTPF